MFTYNHCINRCTYFGLRYHRTLSKIKSSIRWKISSGLDKVVDNVWHEGEVTVGKLSYNRHNVPNTTNQTPRYGLNDVGAGASHFKSPTLDLRYKDYRIKIITHSQINIYLSYKYVHIIKKLIENYKARVPETQ